MELDDGYLTIQAVRSHSNDEKDKKGRYLRHESFSGTCAPVSYTHLSTLALKALNDGFRKQKLPR